MPRAAIDDNQRVAMRITPQDKARLLRAASLEKTDLTHFMLKNSLVAAQKIIEHDERLSLSARDTSLWLNLLDNPPEPNARLIAAAKARLAHQ